ncbi:cation transporter [Marinilabiliaceae bacterium JC017]|nr:cation transporter [Marinilabiliaceae bacterium JC017]
MNKLNTSSIERQSLFVGALVYLLMGFCGWIVYYLSHSEALLLDGNYNMVNGIASFFAFYVAKIRAQKTTTFPFGKFIYEALYSLVKGILVLGILVAALWDNSVKIINYFSEGIKHEVNTLPIAFYTIAMVTLCFTLAFYYKQQNKKTGDKSSMLKTDAQTAIIDGMLSGLAGGGLLLCTYLGSIISGWEFLMYIGDAIVVLLFVLIAFKEPFHIIRHNFIELAGGQLQSQKEQDNILNQIQRILSEDFSIENNYISKTGSLYTMLVYVKPKNEKALRLLTAKRDELRTSMSDKYENTLIELILA